MSRSITIEAAGITCRFLDFGFHNIYADYLNKANPWKIYDVSKTDILVTEELQDWAPTSLDMISEERDVVNYIRVYKDATGNIYKTLEKAGGEIIIAWQLNYAAGIAKLIVDKTNSIGMFAFEYFGTVIPDFLLNKGICTMHGVLMEYQGDGIILTADSGVGKTTHARLWRDEKNAFIINGDRITFRKEADSWIGYGLPWSGSSGEQMNRHVGIKSIVQIVRDKTNYVEQLNGLEAFEVVLGQLLTPAWDPNLAAVAVDMALQVSAEVPVWRLHCTPDREAVDVLEKSLYGK